MNVIRLGEQLIGEFGRRLKRDFKLSASAATVLAIVEGAGGEATPNVIAERAVISSASATSVLDTLESRGLVERVRHPDDRRKVIVRLTPRSYPILDAILPGVHKLETDVMKALSSKERRQLLDFVARLQASVGRLSAGPHEPLQGKRNVPERLGRTRRPG